MSLTILNIPGADGVRGLKSLGRAEDEKVNCLISGITPKGIEYPVAKLG